jgi:hypothetical protein
VISLDGLKLRIFAALERVTPAKLENTWRRTVYSLDTLRSKKGEHAEVV